MFEWYSCGSSCWSAKANGFMAHVRRYRGVFMWTWNGYADLAFSLEDAKADAERVAQGG